MHRLGAHAGVEFVAVCSSMDSRYISSVSSWPRCSEVTVPGSTTTKASKYQHALDLAQGHVGA